MKWIPISKRPPVFKNVLLTDGIEVFEGFSETTENDEDLSLCRNEKGYSVGKITHWMSMPQPPLKVYTQKGKKMPLKKGKSKKIASGKKIK